MFDIVIIGAGPAGLSAAINAKIRNRNVCVIGQRRETSWLFKAEEVNNHLGMPKMTGAQMLESFYNHANELGISIKEGRALQVLPMNDYFMINAENEIIEAKKIILAVGVSKKSSGIKGEEELLGKGVSYCATCDGMLYRNKPVVVYGEIEEGEHDSSYLSNLCSDVHYIHNYEIAANSVLKYKTIKGKISEIIGTNKVEAIKVGENTIDCEGVFIIKSSIPPSSLINGLELENNAIKVNRYMETNIKGVYAAGDCTGFPLQISNAIGEGLIAAQVCDRALKDS